MPPLVQGRRQELAGILLIVAAVLLLSLSDALVKRASAGFAVWQILLVRSAFAVPLVVALAGRRGLRLAAPGWVLARSLCLAAMWVAYYSALPAMSFALAAAALYTAPIFMAVFAAVLLRERVGAHRWAGIALGCLGVLAILRPDAGALAPVALLPFLAAAGYALAATITWRHCRGEPAMAMALRLNLCLAAVGGLAVAGLGLWPPDAALAAAHPFVLRAWPPLGGEAWGLLALLAVFIVVITASVAKAYQCAPAPVIGAFDNLYLPFATLWSGLLLDDWPDAIGCAGIALIALGATLTTAGPLLVRRRAA